MKAQTRMIVASVIVIAFALTAVSGITYSWFSDTEEATISVSTAKMEYVTTWEESYTTDIGTEVTITKGTGTATVAVNNLVPGANLPIIESIVNKSTIKTVYRITAVPELAENHTYTTYDLSNILICGKALDFSYNDGVITLNETVIEDWTLLAVDKNPATQSVYITTPQSYGGDGINSIVAYNPSDGTGSTEKTGDYTEDWSPKGKTGLTIKFTVTAVQGDFPYTEMKTVGETKVVSANIPENKVVKAKTITVSSETGIEDPATVSDVIVDFSNVSTYNTGGETTQEESIEEKSVSVEVKSVDSAGKIEVDLNLKSGETVVESPKFNEPVVVTMTVPGEFTNPVIIYDGKEDGKIISSIIKDGSTTITFSVNHFSEYTIQNITDVHNAETLKSTLEKGIYARLTADISGVNEDITLPSSGKVELDLNGHKIGFTGEAGFMYSAEFDVIGTADGSGISAASGFLFNDGDSKTSVLSINCGDYSGNSGLIGSGGTVIIDGGTFNTIGSKAIISNGTLTINDGTFTAESDVVYGASGAVITINGGTFTAKSNVVYGASGAVITINGGTFKAVGEDGIIVYLYLANNSITINNGTFDGSNGCNCIIFDSGLSTIEINGGKFLYKPIGDFPAATMISSTKECVINDGEFTMVIDENDDVERILLYTSYTAAFTVNGGTFKIETKGSGIASLYYAGGDSPSITVNGGTFEIVAGGNAKVAMFKIFYDTDAASVTNGSFTATGSANNIKIVATDLGEDKFADKTDKKFISGGTFNLDPTNYLKDSSVTKDESGNWVVTASSTQQ